MNKSKDIYNECVGKASLHKNLYHYTNPDALKAILKNHSLRLGCIDSVNDSDENKRITSLWNAKVYVLCFTYELEISPYFFKNYGKIRLEFATEDVKFDKIYSEPELINFFKDFSNDLGGQTNGSHKSYGDVKDWCIYDKILADVYYTDCFNKHIAKNGYELNAGLIKQKSGLDNNGKSRNWEMEAETRLRVALRPVGSENVLDEKTNKLYQPKPDFKHVYIRLPIIKSISLSPFITIEERKQTIQILNDYCLLDKLLP